MYEYMKLIQENNQLNVIDANVCGVYGFQLPDGGWLVGYSNNILNRVCQYYRLRTAGHKGRAGNLKFRAAVDKCGWAVVKVYVLEECSDDKTTLLRKEGEWSRKLDSVKNGYNVMECGVEGGICTTIYDINFKMGVSAAMKEYHAKRKVQGRTGYKVKEIKADVVAVGAIPQP
jgi:hypothetical protein